MTKIPADRLALLASAMNYRRVFVAPPGTSDMDLAVLRDAFAKALQNAELLQKSIESRRPITFVDGDAIRDAIKSEADLARQFAPIVKEATQ